MAATTINIQQYARSALRRLRLEAKLANATDPEEREWLAMEIQSHHDLTAMVESGRIAILDQLA